MAKEDKTASADFFKKSGGFQHHYLRWIENNTHYFLILLFTLIGFIYRLYVTLSVRGVLHPDEVFQALEMGHKIAYGSGVVPPEFENENPSDPSYAASRSWSFPLFFAIIMKSMSFFNLDYFTTILPTIRILLAINSTFLIYSSRKLAWQITKNQNVELFTTVFIAMWFRIVEYTIRSFNNTFFLPVFFFGIYKILLSIEKQQINNRDHLIVTIGLGLASYNRLDLLLIIFAFFVISFSINNFRIYFQYLLDGLLGWGLGLIIDYHYFKEVKVPPVNWVKFNLIENKSDVFAVTPWYYYIHQLIILDNLSYFVGINLLILIITISILYVDKSILYPKHKEILNSYFKLTFVVIFVWIAYTSFWRNFSWRRFIDFLLTGEGWNPMSHKEIRFIIGGLILLLIHTAISFEIGTQLIIMFVNRVAFSRKKIKPTKFLKSEIKYWTNLALTSLLIVLIVSQSISSAQERQFIEQFGDVDQALTYVGHQNDVTGVAVAVYWYQSGGYTFSHFNSSIPIDFLDFTTSDSFSYRYNTLLARQYLEYGIHNYFIVPDYQFTHFSNLMNLLVNNNWVLIKVIDGSVGIWYRV